MIQVQSPVVVIESPQTEQLHFTIDDDEVTFNAHTQT